MRKDFIMSNLTPRQQEVVDAGVKFYLTDGFNVFAKVSEEVCTVNDTIITEVMIGLVTGESHGKLKLDLNLLTEDECWVSAPSHMTQDEALAEVRKYSQEIWRMRSPATEPTPDYCESTGTPWSDWR